MEDGKLIKSSTGAPQGGVISPINAYRSLKVREGLIAERGKNTIATGL